MDSIQTVLNVADHFDRLKQRADGLLSQFGASERGYFTPTEDEQVRQLLVSYWHPRNALIEVVLESRDYDIATSVEEKNVRFLTAFAGALVLIDAARFLRERVHDRPVARSKLNEAEPAFGIPSGVYDRIQKSLTSPVHAWHLFHALQYLAANERALHDLARTDPQLHDLFGLIKRLRHRLDVGIDDFVTARIRTRTRQVTTRLQKDLLFRALYGLQKAVSRLLSEKYVQPGHTPELPQSVTDRLRSQLSPGDVLITRKEFALTNYFLPGYWPHAALYIGREGELNELVSTGHSAVQPWLSVFQECSVTNEARVLEALKDGVRVRSVSTPLSCDAVAVVRPQLTQDDICSALARGFHHIGKPYDFDFDFTRSDRLVCTEVVYRSYEGLGELAFALTPRTGRLTLSAEDLLRMAVNGQGFRTVAVYAPGFATQLQFAETALHVLERTLQG